MIKNAATTRNYWPPILGCPGVFLQSLVFWGIFYCCCRWFVDLQLIYHGGGVIANFPVFYWGGDYLRECLASPGGLLHYVHALFSQCLFHPQAGPAVVSTLAWLLVAGQRVFLKSIGAGALRSLAYAPPFLLLALLSKYVYYTPATLAAFALLTALAGACLYAKVRPSCWRLRCAWLLVLGAFICIAASEAFPVFFLLCLFFDLRQEKLWVVFPLFLLPVALPFVTGRWLFGLTGQEVFASLFPFSLAVRVFKSAGSALLHTLYLGLPAFLAGWLLATGMGRLFHASRDESERMEPSPRSGDHPGSRGVKGLPHRGAPGSKSLLWIAFRWAAGTVLLAAIAGAVLRLGLNAELKAVLQVDYHSYRKMWPQALECAKAASGNIHVACAVNQALYHTGRLGDELPLAQNPDVLLLYDQKYRPDWNVIDLYLELGFINMADHYLVEAVELYGERPSLLRRLALVNAAIGNTGTARIYFNALKRVPYHASWAGDYLRKMADDPSLAGDSEVARMRQSMMKENYIIPLPVETLMLKLLEANKNNRMAFEYLMAHCLLTRNIQAWAQHQSRLGGMVPGGLPRFYQEAAILAARGLGLEVGLQGRRVDEISVKRYEEFVRLMKASGPDRRKAAGDLRNDYGDTYYYYYYLQ